MSIAYSVDRSRGDAYDDMHKCQSHIGLLVGCKLHLNLPASSKNNRVLMTKFENSNKVNINSCCYSKLLLYVATRKTTLGIFWSGAKWECQTSYLTGVHMRKLGQERLLFRCMRSSEL